VPASKFVLSPFLSIFTRILSTDNIWAGLSSFAVEMSELREVLERAGPYSLVLGDEVCSGTESVSAMALVSAGIQWLSNRKTKFIFATHLHDLPTLLDPPALKLRVWHLHVEYDPVSHKLIYDRTLVPGSGSTLYGLEVARAMDLPLEFLELAQQQRHKLLQTTTHLEAKPSSYNSLVRRRGCEVCGSEVTSDLEVHHLDPKASATKGILPNGMPMNDASNLVVLCASCHDKHHADNLVVLPLVQTSEGLERSETRSTKSTTAKKAKWSEEEMSQICQLLAKYKTASLKGVAYQLKEQFGIEISSQTLGIIRRGLN
jgi:DNA mismatch repair protein MutS